MRFRFTILGILLATTLIGVLVAAVGVYPPLVGACVLALLPLVCGSVFLAWAASAHGGARTFAIAAAIPQVVAALYAYEQMFEFLRDAWNYARIPYGYYYETERTLWAVLLAGNVVLSLVTGAIAVMVQRLTGRATAPPR
jgi:hypothetical protein